MPSYYHSFRNNMTAPGLDEMSYKTIRERLITFQESSTIFARGETERTRDRPKVERPAPRRDAASGYVASREGKCFNCGRNGHFVSDCRSTCKKCARGEHQRKDCPLSKKKQAFIGKRGGRFRPRGRGQASSNIGLT